MKNLLGTDNVKTQKKTFQGQSVILCSIVAIFLKITAGSVLQLHLKPLYLKL